MQPGSLRRQLALSFVLLIVAQAVVLALLYSRIKHFAELHTELIQIDALRTEVHALHAAALDAETGQRGFVITGREEFLQPYRAAVLTFQGHIERMRVLVARQPSLQQQVAALSAQLLTAQAEMVRLVELRRHDGFAGAQQLLLNGTQRESMDLLRATSLEIDEQEQKQVKAAERSYLHASSVLINLAFFGFCGTLLATAGLGLFVLARLRALTAAVGNPLAAVNRDLRAAAKAAARDAANLAELAKTDADTKAEEQATLDVITRMAKDLSTVAMEITSSVRVVEEGREALGAEQLEGIISLAGRIAQSALSLELTTAEQRRVFEASCTSGQGLERCVRSAEHTAVRVRKIAKDLVRLWQAIPGLGDKRAAEAAPLDGSESEIAPVRT